MNYQMNYQLISYVYVIPVILSLYKELSKELNIQYTFVINIITVMSVVLSLYYIRIYLMEKKYKYNIVLLGHITSSINPFYGLNIDYNFSIEMESILFLLIDKYKNKFTIIKKVNKYHENSDENADENVDENFNKYIDFLSLDDNIFVGDNEDIAVKITSSDISLDNKNNGLIDGKKIYITLYSNTNNINNFIISTTNKYKKNKNKNQNNNEIKIFTYVKNIETDTNKLLESKLIFSEKILSDNISVNNYETFEHIFNDNVSIIKSDVDKMNDEKFIKKYGLKNKLCYLFHGNYGTGKTSFITALAHEYKRNILEIPFSRIKTNEELDRLINIDKINNTFIDKNKLIIVFDEIDRNNNIINTNDNDECDNDNDNDKCDNNECDKNAKETNKILDAIQLTTDKKIKKQIDDDTDKLNMSFILSKFDGLGNYNGLIIIATTNNINKIHPALSRDMRMSKVYFSYMKKKHIVEMIEKYFEIKLDENVVDKLPDEEDCLSGATCKMLIKNNHDNIDKLLEKIYEKKIPKTL